MYTLFAGGFVDTFRAQHPDVVGYTYFSHRFQARQNNKGWRLDYFLASKSLAPRCYDAWQSDRTKDYQAGATALSDHIPIGLTVTLAPA
ncbi:hypothetical protein FOA52_012055 [Chlamydomonas sp. UWO 241]|nr:hypothetical protein FOA52_012055 [Chlamydomonas sp. UWO 241]